MNNSLVYSILVETAGKFVERMFGLIDTLRLPRVIKKATSVGEVELNETGKQRIDVTIDIDVAPMARAFEFGSGIHATRGEAMAYVISPKKKEALAFIWPGRTANFPRGRKYIGGGSGGKLLFNYVEHPGVEQRPYIAPAIQRVLDDLDETISKNINAEIILGPDEIIEVRT